MICMECGHDNEHAHKAKYVEKLSCAFCATPREDAAFLFKSNVGGAKICICDGCVDKLADVLAGRGVRAGIVSGGRVAA